MKLITTIAFMLAIFTMTYAQDTPSQKKTKRMPERLISAGVLKSDGDGVQLLSQGVKFESGDLYVEADSVIFNKREHTLVAHRVKRFTFNGEVVLSGEQASKSYVLRYKRDDTRVFLE